MKPLDRPLGEVVFLTEFRDFCRMKGGERYKFTDPFGCALAQFEKATGRWDGATAFPHEIDAKANGLYRALARYHRSTEQPTTFSALADRIDALLPASVRSEAQ